MSPEIDLTHWEPIARDGGRFLFALRTDLEAHNLNGDAFVHDTLADVETGTMSLQTWFKWGNWEACAETDRRVDACRVDERP